MGCLRLGRSTSHRNYAGAYQCGKSAHRSGGRYQTSASTSDDGGAQMGIPLLLWKLRCFSGARTGAVSISLPLHVRSTPLRIVFMICLIHFVQLLLRLSLDCDSIMHCHCEVDVKNVFIIADNFLFLFLKKKNKQSF